MQPLFITAYTQTNACGSGNPASLAALRNRESGLRRNDLPWGSLETWIGRVDDIDSTELPAALEKYDCRNNRLAYLALLQDDFAEIAKNAIGKYGPARVGLFLGTSTSGVRETEKAYAERKPGQEQLNAEFDYFRTQNIFSLGSFVREYLGLKGPSEVISTACSSSAKVFATASRFIAAGLCDAAIVGGVDTLCEMTLFGFNSLQLVSSDPCRPFDLNRNGISIGEAGGFALLEKTTDDHSPRLLGYGESSDAYHISSPHPEGLGASTAMQAALERASLQADDIGYLNLHGTATPANDTSEASGVIKVLGNRTPCSSTKGWTGHTLGAAGIVETGFCLLALEHDFIPGTLNTTQLDDQIQANCLIENQPQELHAVMSNSFGFGGSNCSLIFGKAL